LEEDDVLEKYRGRAEKIIDDSDNIGWGFSDSILEIFDNFYE
jgi:hypothetical protein